MNGVLFGLFGAPGRDSGPGAKVSCVKPTPSVLRGWTRMGT